MSELSSKLEKKLADVINPENGVTLPSTRLVDTDTLCESNSDKALMLFVFLGTEMGPKQAELLSDIVEGNSEISLEMVAGALLSGYRMIHR